ncbi:MAG: hypothetical protein ACLVLH_10180 [Eisenbergiella massiliensis]
MPKSYSDQEKEYIIRRLKDEAMNCMSVYGIRRTTVDELVRRVRIPKGLSIVYDSKEQLLFEALMEFHENRNTASAACGAYVRQRAGGGGNNGFADGFFQTGG